MTNWQEIHSNFTPQLQKKWEEKGFSYARTKEWINIGLKVNDDDYALWLRDIKQADAQWVLSHGDDAELRKEYKDYIQLSNEVIEQIKDLDHYNLTFEQELLVDKLILNKELKRKYKKFKLCKECYQPNTSYNWCQNCMSQRFQQNFSSWTSGNPDIDEFIQKSQLEATNNLQLLEWIPYEQFLNVQYLTEGGFGKVYKGEWFNSPINYWNTKDNRWERRGRNGVGSSKVVLKSLNESEDIKADFLQEIANHKLTNYEFIVRCYGISKDPVTKNFLMVMEYIEGGNLRQHFENKNYRLNFKDKFTRLQDIISGLKEIHNNKGLVHRDFHPGNILYQANMHEGDDYYITDLGLSRPVNETNDSEVYGVLPYVAPEVLRGGNYTQAADIYSLGIITAEMFSGLTPYCNLTHDQHLAVKIYQGLRPNLNNVKIPKLFEELINRCWDANPLNRPTASELERILDDWYDEIDNREDTEFYRQYKEIEAIEKLPIELRPVHQLPEKVFMHSKPINTKQITELISMNLSTMELDISDGIDFDDDDLGEMSVPNEETNLEEIIEQFAQVEIPPKNNN